jgi:hypothetical protein
MAISFQIHSDSWVPIHLTTRRYVVRLLTASWINSQDSKSLDQLVQLASRCGVLRRQLSHQLLCEPNRGEARAKEIHRVTSAAVTPAARWAEQRWGKAKDIHRDFWNHQVTALPACRVTDTAWGIDCPRSHKCQRSCRPSTSLYFVYPCMALGSTQQLTGMSTRNLPGV